MVALFLIANFGYAILCWRFFFYTPMAFDVALAVCLTVTLVVPRR